MDEAGLYVSPHQAELDHFNHPDYTPDFDYLEGDNFDFDNADLGGEMIGALPGRRAESSASANDDGNGNGNADGSEKRKSPDDRDTPEEGDQKRQEILDGEKGSKKPGRKPLTSEPTTKRKAQNRAAQRAFRERKEKHLKDLETKVTELTKSHEADRHENGLLKAKVERLQVELLEYRKKLSLNSGASGIRGSPPLTATQSKAGSGAPAYGSNSFQFDFPKFGALPGSQIFGDQPTSATTASDNSTPHRESITPPASQSQSPTVGGSRGLATGGRTHAHRQSSASSHQSPRSITSTLNPNTSTNSPAQYGSLLPSVGYSNTNNMHGFASTLPQMGSDNPFGDLFSPGILNSANAQANNYFGDAAQQTPQSHSQGSFDASSGGDSTAGLQRVFHFNSSSSMSDGTSPSASSSSQWNANGANSSCDTSPEPSHGSPANKLDKSPQPSKLSHQHTIDDANPSNGFDVTVPTTDTFDPVLFGDYRDPSNDAAFGGSADFTSGFFDEALNQGPYDFGSPSTLFGILQSPQQTNAALHAPTGPPRAPTPSRNFMAEVDRARDGGDDDYGLAATQLGLPSQQQQRQQQQKEKDAKLISCNNIWNQLQSNSDFQAGTFDLDSLCSELRAKARCSESGVMVDQGHVDQALKKLGKRDETGKFVSTAQSDMPRLMFEQDSWDNVLKKFGGTRAQL